MENINQKSILKKRLFKGSLAAIFGKVIVAILGLVFNMYLARMLSPIEFGTFILLQALITVFVTVAILGFDRGIIKLVSQNYENIKIRTNIIANVFMYVFLSALVVIIVYVTFLSKILGGILKNEYIFIYSTLIGLWIFLATIQRFITDTFRGLHRIDLSMIFGGSIKGGILINLIFILFFFYQDNIAEENTLTLQSILILININILFVVLIGMSLLKRKFFINDLIKHFSIIPFKNFINLTLPIMFSDILIIVVSRSDLWLTSIFLSKDDIALYGSAIKIILILNYTLIIVNTVLPPIISDLYSKNQVGLLEKVVRSTSSIAFVPAFFIFTVFLFFSSEIMASLFGDFYYKAGIILIILGVGQLFNVLTGASASILLMTGQQSVMLKSTIVSSFFTIILSLILVQKFNIVGIAIGFSAGVILQNALYAIYVKKYVKITAIPYVKLTDYFGIFKFLSKHILGKF